MKPTHILVPVEWIESRQDTCRKVPSSLSGDGVRERMRLLNDIENLPKVDLSEEGINNMLLKRAIDGHDIDSYKNGYQQCAKDLLNTKL